MDTNIFSYNVYQKNETQTDTDGVAIAIKRNLTKSSMI